MNTSDGSAARIRMAPVDVTYTPGTPSGNVPEPTTLLLLGTALAGTVAARRRNRYAA